MKTYFIVELLVFVYTYRRTGKWIFEKKEGRGCGVGAVLWISINTILDK